MAKVTDGQPVLMLLVSNIVNGSSNFIPIFAAIMADSFFGNFSVIVVSSIISLMGLILFMLTVTIPSLRPLECALNVTGSSSATCEAASALQLAVLYLSITLSALGLGGTTLYNCNDGADQFEKPKDQASFFNWYFFSLYVGSIIGAVGIVYIQDNVGWDWGVGICLVANLVALVVLLVGKRYYPRVVVAAIQKRKVSTSPETRTFYHGSSDVVSCSTFSSFFQLEVAFLNCAALKTERDTNEDGTIAKEWNLSYPGVQISLAVPQALRMDRHIGTKFQVPAVLSLFHSTCYAIFITIVDRLVMPTYQKLRCRPLTPLQRVGIGHVLTIAGMAASAIVERKRLSIVWSKNLTSSTSAVTMSGFLVSIPFSLDRFLCIIKNFSFASKYFNRHDIFACCWGFYLSKKAMIDVVRRSTGWLPNNINHGRLDNMFWLLVVIGVLNFGYFIVCSVLYTYKNVADTDEKLIMVGDDNQPGNKS
ncbi:hypothetical protein MKX03_027557 [Papaver bracteatum]|nr:hypothetical protein MKX03_027557 [Papaver bracteatum]